MKGKVVRVSRETARTLLIYLTGRLLPVTTLGGNFLPLRYDRPPMDTGRDYHGRAELRAHESQTAGAVPSKGPDYGVESPVPRLTLFPLVSPSLLVSTL